jgi:pyruvate formate lyase activating enzyme
MACPQHAIHQAEDGKMVTDYSLCTACGTCVDSCNLNLREIAGKEYTIPELVKELRKDEMFYEESGGGVTLSGGEVMATDMDYVEALVKALHRIGITVTIDTCGYAPYENFERILPYVETFLYDIKAMDPEIHKQYMGVDNGLILENLKKLSEAGAKIYIRIPVIKEVNGNDETMQAIIRYLTDEKIRVARVHLLPYHNTGSSKYPRLGEEYKGTDFHAPSNEEMEHFTELFKEAGFHNIKIGG